MDYGTYKADKSSKLSQFKSKLAGTLLLAAFCLSSCDINQLKEDLGLADEEQEVDAPLTSGVINSDKKDDEELNDEEPGDGELAEYEKIIKDVNDRSQALSELFSPSIESIDGFEEVYSSLTTFNFVYIEDSVTTLDCDLGGTLKVTTMQYHQEIVSDQCQTSGGNLMLNIMVNRINDEFEVVEKVSVEKDGAVVAIDFTILSNGDQTVVSAEKVFTDAQGEFLIRQTLDESNVAFYESHLGNVAVNRFGYVMDETQCSYYYSTGYSLNGAAQFLVKTNERDKCIQDFDFERNASWSEAETTLVYQLEVTEDGTDFSGAFVMQDFNSKVQVSIEDEDGKDVAYSFITSFSSTQHGYFDKGIYTIKIKNESAGDEDQNLYFQIKADNSILSFVEELDPPMLLSEVTGQWSELNSEGEVVGLIYKLTVTEPEKMYLRLATNEINLYEKLELINDRGVQLDYDTSYGDLDATLTYDFVEGTYFVLASNLDNKIGDEFTLSLKSDVNNSAKLTQAVSPPELASNDSASTFLVDSVLTVADYTVNISEANYSDVVSAYENIEPLYLIKRNIESVSQVTTTEELDGKKTETTIHNCEVSGSAIEINVEVKGKTLSTYNTQDCITVAGAVVLNYESYDSSESYTFSGITESEKVLYLEYANSIGSIDNETLIDLEGVGQFLVRHNYGATRYYGADGTVLKTLPPTTQTTQTRPACYSQAISEYQLNDNEPFIQVLEEFDDCLTNPTFSGLATWSEVGSALVYNLHVLNDNTPLEAVFFTPDEEAVLALDIKDPQGESIRYYSEYYSELHTENETLDAGIYTIYLKHDLNTELNDGVEFQLNIENAVLSFVEELDPPKLLSEISGQWTQMDSEGDLLDVKYQLTVTEPDEMYLTLSTDEQLYTTLTLLNERGVELISGSSYSDSNANLKYQFEIGTYYILVESRGDKIDDEFTLSLKSDADNSAQLTLALNAPELASNDSATTYLIESILTGDDYTVHITEANYAEIIEIYNNIDNDYSLKRKLEFNTLDSSVTDLEGQKIETTLFACEVSGTAIEVTTTSGDDVFTTYNTQDCVTQFGEVWFNYEYDNGYKTYQYSSVLESGSTYSVEYADRKDGIDTEIYINVESFGSFLVRTSYYYGQHFFGAEGAQLLVGGSTTQPIETKPACYRQTTSDYQLNDSEPFVVILGEIDECLVDPVYSEFATWSEVGSTLVYQLNVLNDNTLLDAVFYTPDEDRVLIVDIRDDQGDSIDYFSSYRDDLVKKQDTLDAGIYTIYLEHSYERELNNGVEFQLSIENAILTYESEIFLPDNMIATLKGEWTNGGGNSSDITIPGNIVYQMDVTQDSIFTFKMEVSEWEYLFLINEDGSLFYSDYGYNYNPAFIKQSLTVGTYYIIAATEDEGETGIFDITVKSDNTDSANVTLYSN